MSGKGNLAIRQGNWKYILDLSTANGWSSWAKKDKTAPTSKSTRPYLRERASITGLRFKLREIM